MEIKNIKRRITYLEHEVIIESNGQTFTYIVNTAHKPDGKSWVQNYRRNYGVGELGINLTTSERKKIKNYFDTEFLKK